MNNRSAIVVCSGGLDSYTLAYYVQKELNPSRLLLLFFNYGQPQYSQEREAVERCFQDVWRLTPNIELKVMDVPQLTNNKGEYVPSRNLVFAALALSLAEKLSYDDIYFGFIDPEKSEESRYWDTTDGFVERLNALAIPTGKTFYAPFSQLNKQEVFAIFSEYALNIDNTWSCMHPSSDGKPCGKCTNCISRFYLKNPMWRNYLSLGGVPDSKYIDNYVNAPSIAEARLLINNVCNLNCGHCFYGHRSLVGEEMGWKEWKVAIDKCVKVGVANFHIAGKEPFINGDIFNFTEYIRSNYPDVTFDVCTNGINVPHYLEQIKQAGFWRVCISIDSFHAGEEEDKDAIVELLLANGIPVNVFTVASKENIKEIPAMYRKYQSMGVTGFYIHPLYMYGNAVGKEDLLITSGEYLALFYELMFAKIFDQNVCDIDFSVLGTYLKDMAKDNRFRAFVEKVYSTGDTEILPNFNLLPHSHCVRFSTVITVMPDGEILGCGTDVSMQDYSCISGGNIKKDDLMEIIKNGRKQIDFSTDEDSTLFCMRDCPNIKTPLQEK